MKRLLLIDGNNLLFRSYYATAASGNLMQNSQGVYTNGIYGFVMAIESILKMEFTHLMVALDAPGKTLRHERYPEYKGTRKETPEPLVMQFPLMKEYLAAANIMHQEKQPYEADDLIGYACKHFKDYFSEILIISNDHDLMQLIDENVHQLVSKKGLSEAKRYTMDVMKEELGIRPDQMPDYKGLCGDPSDNIPGVPGIGDKTAVKLLQEYDTLENVLSHAEEMKGKLRERLLEFKDQARFSKELATIAVDFPYELKPDDLVYHEPEVDQMVAFYQKMEFQSFIRRLQNKKKPVQPVMIHVATIEDDEAIKRILTSPMAIHLELYGTNYHTAQKLGIALVGAKGSGFVPYRIFQKSRILQAWFEDADAHKYVFDAKQLQVALMWDRFVVKGIVFDLKLSAYLVNPNLTREDFRGVSGNFSADVPDDDEAIYGKGAKYQLPDDEIYISHALKKAQTIYQLKTDLSEKNQAFGQDRLLQEIELPLSEVLAQMEYLGIMVSEPILDEFGSDLMRRIETLTSEIHELSGQDFNINSPKQLGTVLFESLGLPYQKRGKTGYSTDISVLNQLRGFHPVIDKIIVYRTLTKLYGTYYEGLKTALKLKDDGRIHTIYKQTLTQTGRLSSVDPNLQNIPIRTEEGREL
ncbi:MAG: DNA polymerase, partial [Candidatus Izemoplasmatales bacterium]|nr:DNA polymerase [Candidatus Izemoplasmatales bacterium]